MSYPSGDDQWPAENYNPYPSYDQQQSYSIMNSYDSFMATDSYTSANYPASYYPSSVAAETTTTNPTTSSLVSNNEGYSLKQTKQSRSRASKSSPTTVVKAQDPNNFRSIVQQLTGCPTGSSLMPPGAYRGSVSINFAQGDQEDDYGESENYYGANSSSAYIPFGSSDTDYSAQRQFQFQQQTQGEEYPSSYGGYGASGNDNYYG